MVKIDEISLETEFNKVSFIKLTNSIVNFIKENNLNDGFLVVQVLHTTCSIFFEEDVHDRDGLGYDFLQHDLLNGLQKIFPKQLLYDSDYKYPGPIHRAMSYDEYEEYRENPAILLNGDAHLKATIIGNSLIVIVRDGKLQLGDFGEIYFVDWDTNRKRNRKCLLCFVGDKLS